MLNYMFIIKRHLISYHTLAKFNMIKNYYQTLLNGFMECDHIFSYFRHRFLLIINHNLGHFIILSSDLILISNVQPLLPS